MNAPTYLERRPSLLPLFRVVFDISSLDVTGTMEFNSYARNCRDILINWISLSLPFIDMVVATSNGTDYLTAIESDYKRILGHSYTPT
jgi:hypothetical protein